MARARESLWLAAAGISGTIGAALLTVAATYGAVRAHFSFWSSIPMMGTYAAFGVAFICLLCAARGIHFPFATEGSADGEKQPEMQVMVGEVHALPVQPETRDASSGGPTGELSRFGLVEPFIPPPDQICDCIRKSLIKAKPAGNVVFTGRSGSGKTALAGWAARDPEVHRNFKNTVVVEFGDDWPPESRADRAFDAFRSQIGAAGSLYEEIDFDKNLVSGSTLLIFDDVRHTSDLKQFFEFFDKCTLLVTALDPVIATGLAVSGRPSRHFDLASPAESPWVRVWIRTILTHRWLSANAVGDLAEKCVSPLLATRLNRAVLNRARHGSSVTDFNRRIKEVAAEFNMSSPTALDDSADDPDRTTSAGKSAEFMLTRIGGLPKPPSNPADRFRELGALPADVSVPAEVLDELWDSAEEATRGLLARLTDLGVVKFEQPEPRHYPRGRVRLHDSDRQYLREQYPEHINRAHKQLLKRADQGKFDSPITRKYWADHRIWHLIGAQEHERIIKELTRPESVIAAALSRGIRSVEYDMALVLAYCSSSQLRNKNLILRPLLDRIRQSADVLEQCRSRESFCPTLAARLQGEEALAGFMAGLSRYARDVALVVKGQPHDMDDPRLIRRLGKRVAGVKALSWLTEPDLIGIAYRDGSAVIWDPDSDQPYKSRLPDSARAAVACWSPHGGVLAIGRASGTVTVWPSPARAGPETLTGQAVTCLAWSRTGELAYAGWRGELACWSPSGGMRRRATGTSGLPVTAVGWSDGGILAFASAQGSVFILSEGDPVQVLPRDPGGAASLAWSGKGLLACAGWDGTVRVIGADRTPCAIQPEPSDRRGPAAIAWDQNGDQLSIGGYDGTVAVWSAAGYRTVLPPQAEAVNFRTVRALAWSPTAPFLAVAHDGGAIQIWRGTGPDDAKPMRIYASSVVGVGWSAREDRLVAAGSDGAVAVWAPFAANDALQSVIRTDGPTVVRCSPDGRRIALAEETGAVRLWDVKTREDQKVPLQAAWKPALGWAPAGASRIAIGGADGIVREWSANHEWKSRVLHEHSAWVLDLAWSLDEQLATLGRDWVLHITQRSLLPYDLIAHEGGTTAMAWNPRGSFLATAGNDWLVRIWRLPGSIEATPPPSRQESLVAEFGPHLGGVTALQWAPGGTELATAGWDRRVRRWQLRLPAAPASRGQSQHVSWRLADTWRTGDSAVTLLAWSPDGTKLVGGDRKGHLLSWRCGYPSCTSMPASHKSPITALRWSKRANRILSAGADGTLRLWNADGQECARIVFRAPLCSLDIHDDSGIVAVGGEYGATILQLRSETAMEESP